MQSRALEKVFVRRRIPHKVVGVRFYERKEVKDVLSYLKVLHNPDDSVGMARVINVPPRGIGQKTVSELDRWARELGRLLVRGAAPHCATGRPAPRS